jgi:HTH-type transcriptional regulator, competence development regulator
MPRGPTATQRQRAQALGAEILRLRVDRGRSLRDLAAKLPMSPSNLGRIERGEQGPPPEETITLIADALDADPNRLLRLAGRLPDQAAASFEQGILQRMGNLEKQLGSVRDTLHADLQRIEKAIGEKRPRH